MNLQLLRNRIYHIIKMFLFPWYLISTALKAYPFLYLRCNYKKVLKQKQQEVVKNYLLEVRYDYCYSDSIPLNKGNGMVIDYEKCVGCNLCSLACSYKHFNSFNPARSAIQIYKSEYDAIDFPVVCSQCTEQYCINTCPTGALVVSSSGISSIDYSLCISCKLCALSCKWGNIFIDPISGFPLKCDLCRSIDEDPECVKWCEPKAIRNSERKT